MEQEIEKLKAIIAEKDAELNRLKQKHRYDVSCAGLNLTWFLRFANVCNYIIAHFMLRGLRLFSSLTGKLRLVQTTVEW